MSRSNTRSTAAAPAPAASATVTPRNRLRALHPGTPPDGPHQDTRSTSHGPVEEATAGHRDPHDLAVPLDPLTEHGTGPLAGPELTVMPHLAVMPGPPATSPAEPRTNPVAPQPALPQPALRQPVLRQPVLREPVLREPALRQPVFPPPERRAPESPQPMRRSPTSHDHPALHAVPSPTPTAPTRHPLPRPDHSPADATPPPTGAGSTAPALYPLPPVGVLPDVPADRPAPHPPPPVAAPAGPSVERPTPHPPPPVDAPADAEERDARGSPEHLAGEGGEQARSMMGLRSAMPALARVTEGLRGALSLGRPGAWALAAIGLLAAVVTGWYVLRGRPVAEPVAAQAQAPARPAQVAAGGLPPRAPPAGPSPTPSLVVHVGGKVRDPGVLTLPAGARVVDALRAAGGPRPGVDTGRLNLARRLIDGEQILVGVPGAEAPPPPGGVPGAPTDPGAGAGPASGTPGATPLDLNAATAAQLEQLPGIGPVLAQRIVEHRTRIGGFRSVDQLRDVTGIGEKKYAELAPGVRV